MVESMKRREFLVEILTTADGPVTGTNIAKQLHVSRQIIVGDIAILRAAGVQIIATPQGYILPHASNERRTVTYACQHGMDGLQAELAAMIDNGGRVLDVVVEHPVYGEIRGNLMLASRRDLAGFMDKLTTTGAEPLLALTGGIHLHTVEADSDDVFAAIRQDLKALGFLIE